MKLPESTGKVFWSFVGGAIVTTGVGFFALGWTTGGAADDRAKAASQSAVVAALAQICVAQSMADPERDTTLVALNTATTFQRRGILEESGWATMPGAEDADRLVATACATELLKTTGG